MDSNEGTVDHMIVQSFFRRSLAGVSDGLRARGALWLLGSLLAACAVPPGVPPTLYQRLGGATNVAAVTSRTVDRAAADPRTRRSFDSIKLQTLKDSIAQQICSISGGGCRYEGETMANAHKEAAIRASEFDALVTILREEFDRSGTDPAAKNGLLKLLAPMRRDIVDDAVAPAASQKEVRR